MSTPDDELRAFTRRLFDDPKQTPPEPDPQGGNHSPREGNNPPPKEPADMTTFARNLFERALRD